MCTRARVTRAWYPALFVCSHVTCVGARVMRACAHVMRTCARVMHACTCVHARSRVMRARARSFCMRTPFSSACAFCVCARVMRARARYPCVYIMCILCVCLECNHFLLFLDLDERLGDIHFDIRGTFSIFCTICQPIFPLQVLFLVEGMFINILQNW